MPDGVVWKDNSAFPKGVKKSEYFDGGPSSPRFRIRVYAAGRVMPTMRRQSGRHCYTSDFFYRGLGIIRDGFLPASTAAGRWLRGRRFPGSKPAADLRLTIVGEIVKKFCGH
jgi:hypothetical protein